MKKTISIVFALLLVAMLFVSCSSGGGDDKEGPSSIVGPAETSGNEGGDNEVSEVAVILQTYNGSFWSDVMRGVDKAIDELAEKGVKCTFNGPDDSTNLQAQIEMIEAAVARDVDALAVAPADSAAVGGAMGICQDKNIPVVLFDCSADSDWPVCLVSSDNYKLGLLAGEALGKAMDGKGMWAMVNWNDGVITNGQRSWGARDYIEENYPDMELYQLFFTYSVTDADLTFARDTLTAKKDFGGFITGCEGNLAPVLSAVQEAGRVGEVKLVAIDITPVSIEYIKDGTVAAVVTQNPFNMGYTGTMTAYKAALGEEVPEFIDSGSAIVDKDSMENNEETRAILKDLQLLDA